MFIFLTDKLSWWTCLCETSLRKIYPTFKKAAGEADREINSNEGRSTSWVDELYYYPPASAAAADESGDRDEDKIKSQTQRGAFNLYALVYWLHLLITRGLHRAQHLKTDRSSDKQNTGFILSVVCGYSQY